MPRILLTAKKHYNYVTDSWKKFMGDNFHFGYFDDTGVKLSHATDMLIEKMLEQCSVTKRSKILDVGCGIGKPAFYMHKKFRCDITGISTSERGIQLANAASKVKGYSASVRFKVADGQDNGFPDGTFDIVWVMESSHLMRNKRKLFQESFRVLKKGGTLVLCDIILFQPLSFPRQMIHFMRHCAKYLILGKTWGNADVNSLGFYCNGLIGAGFQEVTALDVSGKTIPTLRCWKNNAQTYLEGKMRDTNFTDADINQFIRGSEILEEFFSDKFLGYGIIKAIKK